MTLRFNELSAFTRGYFEAALFTLDDDLSHLGYIDIDESTKQKMIEDARNFDLVNNGLYGLDKLEQAGRDFWFTRNGHGVGFWDRPELYGKKNADKLTRLAEACRPFDLYLGDDGKLHA